MEVDRELVLQVGVSVIVVLLFILGLAFISSTFGQADDVDGEPLNGTLEGDLSAISESGGTLTATIEGEYDNSIQAELDGEIEGTTDGNGTFEGTYVGSIEGPIDGNASGDVAGTVDTDDETFTGTFNGTATGTTSTSLTPDGGLVLIGLLVAFIIAMPVFGYYIQWATEDEADG